MQPSTSPKPKITTAGRRAANSIAEVRQNVNLGATPAQARATLRDIKAGSTLRTRTGFTVPMPDAVPSEALNGNFSIQDVRANRDTREQADIATNQFNTDFNNLTGRIGNTTLSSPFTDPEATLNRLLLRGSTDTQMALDEKGQTQANNIRGFADEYSQAGTDARTQFRLPELQQELGNTRNQIAERRVRLRETLRDFESNAERRGVAREFVDSEKAKVQADAATELADLSIIESAQLGNLNEARAEVDDLLAEKKQAFEFENLAIEAEIARLDKMDTRESAARKEQLQIALTERTRNIETALANEKEQRGYLVDAAANGADSGTLTAIRNAKSPQEAAFLASPFIGKLDRQQKQLDMAVKSEQLAKLRQPTVATLDTEILEVNGTKQLINSQTGEVIATFGAGTSTDEITQAKDTAFINTLDSLKTHPGLNKAVGTSGLARFTPFKVDTMDGDVSDFTSSVQNVVKQLTLNTFAEAKEKGMTFGAMSQGEWDILGQAATKLVGWTRTRDDGSVYYDTSEKNIKKEFDTLSNFGKMSAIRKGVPPEQIGVVTMADGSYVTRNSDGTYTVLDVTAQ